MTDIYAAEFEIVVEQIDGDSQLVNFIRRVSTVPLSHQLPWRSEP